MSEDFRPEKTTRRKFFGNGKVEKQQHYYCEEEIQQNDRPIFEDGTIYTCDKNEHCTSQFLTYKGLDLQPEIPYCKLSIYLLSQLYLLPHHSHMQRIFSYHKF